MKYTNSYKISVDFQPWFDKDNGRHRFTKLHMYEELGGLSAYGTMDMEMDASGPALKLIKEERTGTITIEKEGGNSFTIPIYITKLDTYLNFVTIDFVCTSNKDFYQKKNTDIKKQDIKATIESLYPGKKEIRCETDIQGGGLVFYQNKESDMDILTRLCYSFKKDSVFAFGWEGLLIKETMGDKNSKGKHEPDDEMRIRGDSEFIQLSNYYDKARPGIYKQPINVWEDTEGLEAVKDYTDLEPINLRVLAKYGSKYYMHKDYYQLHENGTYNKAYMDSDLFQGIVIVDYNMPNYKIGDVLEYKQVNKLTVDTLWPFKYYIVKSNELFISLDDSDYVDANGQHCSWTTRLLGLEENGSIAIGSDTDPQEGKTA